MPIERALISVYDKTGVVEFAKELEGAAQVEYAVTLENGQVKLKARVK